MVKREANKQAASGGGARGKLDLGKLYASCITLGFQGNVDPIDGDSREGDQSDSIMSWSAPLSWPSNGNSDPGVWGRFDQNILLDP